MIAEWHKLRFGSVKGETESGEGWMRKGSRKKKREKVGKDLHMVSCWSPSMVTVDICRALLGLISRTQL